MAFNADECYSNCFLQAVPFHQCSDLPLYTIKYITKITIKTYTYFLFLLHFSFHVCFCGIWYRRVLWWCSIKSWNWLDIFNRKKELFMWLWWSRSRVQPSSFGALLVGSFLGLIAWYKQANMSEQGSSDLCTNVINPILGVL